MSLGSVIWVSSYPIVLIFDRLLGSSTAEAPVRLQSETDIRTYNFAASKSGDKISYCILNRYPHSTLNCCCVYCYVYINDYWNYDAVMEPPTMLLVPICRDMQLWWDKPPIPSPRNRMPGDTCFDDVGRNCACVTCTQMYVMVCG